MPPMGGLTDQQIADVLTFVLRAYGPNAGPVSAAEVRPFVVQQQIATSHGWRLNLSRTVAAWAPAATMVRGRLVMNGLSA